jgi:hypothetical protein
LQFADLGSDDFQNTGKILNHIGVPKPEHDDIPLGKPSRTFRIAFYQLRLCMLTAVEFNSEAKSRAIEVENEWPGRMLSAKVYAELSVPQLLPEAHFDIGRV